jgi:hypothetical protein
MFLSFYFSYKRNTTCFACRRKFQSEKTYVHQKLKLNYCNSKLSTSDKLSMCNICNVVLKTEHCKIGHKKICNGKGHFGFKCLKCKKFTYKRNNETSDSIKQAHQCGIEKCNNCGNNYNPESYEDVHLCPLKKETFAKYWPTLAFLNIEFEHISEQNCYDCFVKKKCYANTHKKTLSDIFKLPKSEELVCDDHLVNSFSLNPNISIIYKENKTKRGTFSKYVFADICKNSSEDNILTFDYTKNIKTPSKFVPSKPRLTGDLKNILNSLQKMNNEYLTLIDQIFKTIFQDNWRNTTFILQDEDSIKMVIFQLSPDIFFTKMFVLTLRQVITMGIWGV